MSACEHPPESLTPLTGWMGRYRCLKCWAIGFKGVGKGQVGTGVGGIDPSDVLSGKRPKRVLHFVPYVCQQAGCTKNAVVNRRNPLTGRSRRTCKAHTKEHS